MDRGGGGGDFKPWIVSRCCVKNRDGVEEAREHICDERLCVEDKADGDTAAGEATAT